MEWGSFDNLQKLETSGTFSQGGMNSWTPMTPARSRCGAARRAATATTFRRSRWRSWKRWCGIISCRSWLLPDGAES